jgi:iron complex outermembrane receptor protein
MRTTLLVLLLLVASSATAQDSLRRVSGTPVTVSGVASPIDSLPISVSTRRIEPTQTASSNSLEQAVRAVPGLQIDNRNNYALGDRITMRGIGARSFFGTRGIRVIKDDIPLTFADGQTNLEIIDPTQLASVTVLHCPASSIFGNASGGTLLFKSLMPPSPGTLVRGGATFGSHGYQRFNGSIGTTSGDLAYGAYITLDSMKGYRDWSGMNAVHFGTQALYTFDEDALRLTFDNVSFSAQNPGALSQLLLDGNRQMAFANNVRQKTGKDGRQSQVGLTYLNDLGGSDLTSSAYAIFRNITNPTPQQIVGLDRSLIGSRTVWNKYSAPLDSLTARSFLTAFFRIFEFSTTLDVQYQQDKRLEHANDSGRKGTLQTDQDENILNVGLGVHLSMPVGRAGSSLMLGMRGDLVRFQAQDRFITADNPDQSGTVTMGGLSWMFGYVAKYYKDHEVLVTSSQGFETPTSTELANRTDGSGGYNTQLEPQKISSSEVGLRGSFAEGLKYKATGFFTDISDALIPFQVADQEGRDFYRNAGEITNNGVEIELIAQPVEGLKAMLGYTFVYSTFKNYVVETVSFKGKRQPGVHPHLGSIDLTYRTPFDLELNANVRYAAKVAVNDANTFYSPEYTVLDLKASYDYTYSMESRTLRISPYVHALNVLDRKYIGSFAINAFGNRYYEPSPERTIYAGILVAL